MFVNEAKALAKARRCIRIKQHVSMALILRKAVYIRISIACTVNLWITVHIARRKIATT